MRIDLPWLRQAVTPTPTPVPAANRYATWCNAETVIAEPFAGKPLTPHELAIAEAWAREQASCGIYLSILTDGAAAPRALAIAGAPGHCPDYIVYPVADGYQTDEPYESTWSASLLATLCDIRPMSDAMAIASLPQTYPSRPSLLAA